MRSEEKFMTDFAPLSFIILSKYMDRIFNDICSFNYSLKATAFVVLTTLLKIKRDFLPNSAKLVETIKQIMNPFTGPSRLKMKY